MGGSKAPCNCLKQDAQAASEGPSDVCISLAEDSSGAKGSAGGRESGCIWSGSISPGASIDMPPKGTQRSAKQASTTKTASKNSTDNVLTKASAQRAPLQLMVSDSSLQQLPSPPGGVAQAAILHSSDSQDASQRVASCAEESGSSSTARGAASQAAAIPQESTLTSDGQAAGSHSSPGTASSPSSFCRCLLLCLQVALIRPLADKTVIKHTLINGIRVLAHDHKMPPTCRELGRAQSQS